ncbi:hypothetical protein DFH28DRAFT_1123172 [Melampsora americana]|nr:hypothetical protein DFH28DRAFT_1123172 [Melampsora americana]
MAEHTSTYEYPVKSVVLPKRLHSFLAYNTADPLLDATTREYHQIIEVFHPKLALPLNLGKNLVIQIFRMTVLPFLRRPKAFDKDTCVYSYISTDAHPEHEKPYPTGSLVLPRHLIKFIGIHDDADMIVDFDSEDFFGIIALFFPHLHLPRIFDCETLRNLFEISVLPYLRRLEDFDECSGFIRYLKVEVLCPIQQKVIPVQVARLPVNLHKFLAFANPNVSVIPCPTAQEILQIMKLFHPQLSKFWRDDEKDMMGPLNMMVLPYLRNIISFNSQDGTLTYSAVDL